MRIRDVRLTRQSRRFDARNRLVYVVVKGVSRQNSGTGVSGEDRGASVKWKHTQNPMHGSPRTSRAIGSHANTRPASPTEGIRPNFRRQLAITPREKRFQPFPRASIACARHWSPVPRLRSPRTPQSSKSMESFEFRKSRYPCRRYRRVL